MPIHSSKNIVRVSVSTDTVDASTQTTSVSSDPVTDQLANIMKMLTHIADELASHGSDIYEIRKKTSSLENKFEHIELPPPL